MLVDAGNPSPCRYRYCAFLPDLGRVQAGAKTVNHCAVIWLGTHAHENTKCADSHCAPRAVVTVACASTGSPARGRETDTRVLASDRPPMRQASCNPQPCFDCLFYAPRTARARVSCVSRRGCRGQKQASVPLYFPPKLTPKKIIHPDPALDTSLALRSEWPKYASYDGLVVLTTGQDRFRA